MQFSFFEELLRLLFNFCNKNSILFVSIFDHSDFLVGFNFCYIDQRFTHVSNSFQRILGYDENNILSNGNFSTKIIHPQDKYIFEEYLKMSPNSCSGLNIYSNQVLVKRTKFRARHVRGYWKYFIIFSTRRAGPRGPRSRMPRCHNARTA